MRQFVSIELLKKGICAIVDSRQQIGVGGSENKGSREQGVRDLRVVTALCTVVEVFWLRFKLPTAKSWEHKFRTLLVRCRKSIRIMYHIVSTQLLLCKQSVSTSMDSSVKAVGSVNLKGPKGTPTHGMRCEAVRWRVRLYICRGMLFQTCVVLSLLCHGAVLVLFDALLMLHGDVKVQCKIILSLCMLSQCCLMVCRCGAVL
jgi:hypothetical protein